MYDLHFPEIEIDPNTKGTSDDEYEKLESPWRDAILNKLNCALGDKGINELTNKIKDSSKSARAYVAFFTKYDIEHFAYAKRQHLVIKYKNVEWGPDCIHRIFAHETCHIFGTKMNMVNIMVIQVVHYRLLTKMLKTVMKYVKKKTV